MAKDNFSLGYQGNENLTTKDFAKYSMQELKNMMKAQAKRLNTRLSALENNGMKSSYAYQKAKQMAYDATKSKKAVYQFMREQEQPRFETAVNVYENVDGGQMKVRARTRAEIIEQLIYMGKWESYESSTVSGMLGRFKDKFDIMKERGFTGTFDEFVSISTTDAYETIRHYYGSDTAINIITKYGEKAADAFIAAHPEYFSKNSPIGSESLTFEDIFETWYEANWEDTSSITEDEIGITSSITEEETGITD